MLTTFLDLLGLVLVLAFAWFVWAPLPLLVGGIAVLLASWRLSGGKARVKRPKRREGDS